MDNNVGTHIKLTVKNVWLFPCSVLPVMFVFKHMTFEVYDELRYNTKRGHLIALNAIK